MKGIGDFIVDDTEEARVLVEHPLEVTEGPLMDGMVWLATHSARQDALPQVVKSARL